MARKIERDFIKLWDRFQEKKSYRLAFQLLIQGKELRDNSVISVEDYSGLIYQSPSNKEEMYQDFEQYLTTHCGKLYLIPTAKHAGLPWLPRDLYIKIFQLAEESLLDYPVVKFFLTAYDFEQITANTFVEHCPRRTLKGGKPLLKQEMLRAGYHHCKYWEVKETLSVLVRDFNWDMTPITMEQLKGFKTIHEHWPKFLYAVDYITKNHPKDPFECRRMASDTIYLREAQRGADYRPYRTLLWNLYGVDAPQSSEEVRPWLQHLYPERDFTHYNASQLRTLARDARFAILKPVITTTIPYYFRVKFLTRYQALQLYIASFKF